MYPLDLAKPGATVAHGPADRPRWKSASIASETAATPSATRSGRGRQPLRITRQGARDQLFRIERQSSAHLGCALTTSAAPVQGEREAGEDSGMGGVRPGELREAIQRLATTGWPSQQDQ